jgi:hypothetical protein
MKFNKTWDIKSLAINDVTTEVYFTMSEATRAPNDFVFAHLTQDASVKYGARLDAAMTIVHAVIGLMSEHVELLEAMANNDAVNVAEEITDMDWYGGAAGRVLYPDIDSLVSAHDRAASMYDAPLPAGGISVIFSQMADDAKRYLYYAPLEEWQPLLESEYGGKLRSRLNMLWTSISNIRRSLNIDTKESRFKNLKKLQEGRYGYKFDYFRALHRDLAAERSILEA